MSSTTSTSRKENKVSKGAKKFWNTISTGWVVEYPPRDGPGDFFDRRDRVPYGVKAQRNETASPPSYTEDDASDKIFRWKEQLRASGKA